jgi:ribosomal protein S17E
VAIRQDGTEEIRGIVMQEVTRQLGPLADRVGLLSNNIERLYNSNGGPPGFLQTTSKEQEGRFKMIFNILDEHMEEIRPIKDFITSHEVREKEHEKFQNKRDQEIKDAMTARHEENKEKLDELATKVSKRTLTWTIAAVGVALASLFVIILSVYVMVKLAKTSDLHQFFPLDKQGMMYSVENASHSATIPLLR